MALGKTAQASGPFTKSVMSALFDFFSGSTPYGLGFSDTQNIPGGGEHVAHDWLAIRTEYVSTNTSMKKLADKYDVSVSAIKRKAVAEGWTADRTRTEPKVYQKTVQKVVQKVATQEADRILTLLSISDKLARRIDQAASDDVDSQDILRLTSALKNIRDVALTGQTGEDALHKLDKLIEGITDAAKEEKDHA